MAATLKLVETAARLTYTGLGAMAGYSLVIQKDPLVLDCREVVPVALAQGRTWQSLKADLASRLA
jgi:hypothetical protein